MNLERLIMMVVRMFMRKGINAGINRVASGGRDKQDMTPEEKERAQMGQQSAKRAKQAMRVTRRMGRF